MLEFLASQNSSETPSFLSILLAVLCSFFLSSLIVITYEFTSREQSRSDNFLQSLALISIVAATVMQAIGDSLARGLGMLGALAIIRFRTRLDNPRNMTFIFASLAVGISCGVYGFTIAFVGTILFCTAAIILRFTRFTRTADLQASLRIVTVEPGPLVPSVEALFSKYCRHWSPDQYRIDIETIPAVKPNQEAAPLQGRLREANYQLAFRDRQNATALLEALNGIDGIKDIRLRFNSTSVEI